MEGFFTEEEIESCSNIRVDLNGVDSNCVKCGLYKTVKTPKMKYSGEGRLNCLIVGEAPGSNEDAQGVQFEKHAQAGGYLRQEISLHNLELDRDFWKTNAVCCRPIKKTRTGESNRPPTNSEIDFCRPLLFQTIKELNPRFIWLLGGVALESFYGSSFKDKSISRFRGTCIPDQKYNAWILPMFHPSYIVRDANNETLPFQFARDMKSAIDKLSLPSVYTEDHNKMVDCITNFDDLISALNTIIMCKPSSLEVDFETTGLKPYYHGHKILSISMCDSIEHAISFPFEYQQFWDNAQFVQIKKRVRKILTDKQIFKMAHNHKFEYVWAHEILGVDSGPWTWDSLVAAHILDNRRKFSGLKFQTYINFGVYPYDNKVERYIRGFPFNKMEKCPLPDLLFYGGLDALFGYRLESVQVAQFKERGRKLSDAYKFFHKGSLAMGKLEIRGICTDEEYYEKQSNKDGTGLIDKEIKEAEKRLRQGKEAQLFRQNTGKEIDLDSTVDLGTLLYDILDNEPVLTEKGNRSVDEKALKKLDISFTHDLLKYRRLLKLTGTYLAQFKRYSFKGKMHPSFDLTIPVSYRSSSSDPNFQNIPKRDDHSKMVCRKGIIPRPGRGLLSSDFSGVEVAISACYNKDKNLIKYITDEKTDMHRDSAADIWLLPHEEITKEIRFSAKNSWVFAQFYNSFYVNCAKELWGNYLTTKTNSGVTLGDHMRKKGITDLYQFTEHCKKVEQKFWGERFYTYKKWKNAITKEYQKNGFIETYFGFQYTGYMTRNECCNYQTQGTAFHCLLWTLLEVEKIAEEEKWESIICGQIHDDIFTDYTKNELEDVVDTIDYVGTELIREKHKWIIVPLKIEHEISGINGNWGEMKEYKNERNGNYGEMEVTFKSQKKFNT